MKIVAKPIKAVAIFEYEDNQKPPLPYKFKIKEYRALTIHGKKLKRKKDILRQYPYHIDVIYD